MGFYRPLPGKWIAFTPVWTNLSVGNGTNTGSYIQFGKTVFFHTELTLGSTSTVTGPVEMNWPISPAVSYSQFANIGSVQSFNGSTAFNGFVAWQSTTLMRLFTGQITGSNQDYGDFSSTVPFTWATGHHLTTHAFYEAA